jgi:hypothetical protein
VSFFEDRKRERVRRDSRRGEEKQTYKGEVRDTLFPGGRGRKRVCLLEDSQALLAGPSDKNKNKVKTLVW